MNTLGSYNCSCNAGFRELSWGGKIQQCADINECQVSTSSCGPNSVCGNTFGGFTCTCLAGFEKEVENDPTGNCVDIDECKRGTHICNIKFPLDCENVDGSYTCKVPEGLDLDGKLILDWLSFLSEESNVRL